MTRIAKNIVLKLLIDVWAACAEDQDRTLRHLPSNGSNATRFGHSAMPSRSTSFLITRPVGYGGRVHMDGHRGRHQPLWCRHNWKVGGRWTTPRCSLLIWRPNIRSPSSSPQIVTGHTSRLSTTCSALTLPTLCSSKSAVASSQGQIPIQPRAMRLDQKATHHGRPLCPPNQRELCGAAEPDDANGHAPLYEADERSF
jgi:hypothetical protein